MKNHFVIACLILLGLASSFSQQVYAQEDEQLTEYEKGRLRLSYMAIEKISNMYNRYGYSGEALAQMMLLDQMLKNKDISTPRAIMESLEEVISDICGVTAFMPGETVDERYFTGKYRSICEWYGSELAILDKSISEEDIAYEKEKVKKRAMTNNIEKQVKKDFIVWNSKKETEKTVTYEQRLKDRSVWVFDSICQQAIENHWMDNLRYRFLEYDADKEILQMKLWYSDKDNNELAVVMYNIYVTPNLLENLKNYGFRKTSIISEGVFLGYLFPIKVYLTAYDDKTRNYRSCLCQAVTEGVGTCEIDFDKLNIDNQYLTGVKRQATFEKYYNLYHQLGDSIAIYNKKLRQHPGYFNEENIRIYIKHKETLVSNSSNTQIKYNNFKGTIIGDGRWNTLENKINPSQEAYDEFLNDIILFYDECLPYLDFVYEVKTLFPGCLGRSMDETKSNVRSEVGYWAWNGENPIRGINIDNLRKLSEAKSSPLVELYQQYCNFITSDKSTNKVYLKNQQYFTSAEDFVRAYYLSGNFKAELKVRKAQAK